MLTLGQDNRDQRQRMRHFQHPDQNPLDPMVARNQEIQHGQGRPGHN